MGNGRTFPKNAWLNSLFKPKIIISADGFVFRDKSPYCLQHGKPVGSPAKSSKEMGAIIIETNYISEKKLDTLSPKSAKPASDASKSPKSPAVTSVQADASKSPKSPKSAADPKSPKSSTTTSDAKLNSPKSPMSVDTTSKSLLVETTHKQSPKSPSNKSK